MRLMIVLALTLFAPAAMAADLTTGKANGFLESLDAVHGYAESIGPDVREQLLAGNMMSGGGEGFAPYRGAMAHVQKAYPEIYGKLGDIVDGYGFASPEDWAETGDKVVMAYTALNIDPKDMAEMEAISPEMLQQMPASMRPQMERVMAMMKAVKNTPQSDIDVVRPLAGKFEKAMSDAPGLEQLGKQFGR